MHEALQRGVEVDDVLNAVAQARNSTDMGLVAMVSASIVHRRGDSAFLEALAQKGLDGVIIPDLDPQQAPPLLTAADQHGLSFSLLIAPTTPEHRIEALVQSCRGFIYLLARGGLTGATDSLPDLEDRVATIRQFTDLPIAAGFGIGSAHQVRAATEACDAAIVGSALIKEMAGADDPLLAAASFVESLAEGLA